MGQRALTYEVGNAYFCVAFRFAASRAFSGTATEPLLLSPSSRASGPLRARASAKQVKCGDENKGRSRGLGCDSRVISIPVIRVITWMVDIQRNAARRRFRALASLAAKPASSVNSVLGTLLAVPARLATGSLLASRRSGWGACCLSLVTEARLNAHPVTRTCARLGVQPHQSSLSTPSKDLRQQEAQLRACWTGERV